MTTPALVRIGFIRRPVGLRGEVLVEPLTDDPGRFRAGIELHAASRLLTVKSAAADGQAVRLTFDGLPDRGAVESLRGEYLEIEPADLAELAEGSFYHWQLLGLRVVDARRGALGVIADIEEYPANDVYVVESDAGRILVPAIKTVVKQVDLGAGEMSVELPDEVEVR